MSGRLVLDASAAVRAVLPFEGAEEILNHLESVALVLAPTLFCSEVANTLWKYQRSGRISSREATEKVEQCLGLIDRLVDDRELAVEALGAAMRYRHPVYDLLYAVLARRSGCPVLTADSRLASILRKMRVDVL